MPGENNTSIAQPSEDPSLRAIYNVLSSQPNGTVLTGYLEHARNAVMADATEQGYNADDDRAMRMALERSTGGQPQPNIRRLGKGAGAFVQRTPTGNGLLAPGQSVNLGLPAEMAERTASLPVAILRHEVEHTRQGPVSTEAHNAGVDEVGPKISDIVAQAQAFKDQTGRPLEASLDNPAGTYQPSVEWMRRQAIRYGINRRSMDQLLATHEGQAWIRKMIEGSENLPTQGAEDGHPLEDSRNRFGAFTNNLFSQSHLAAGKKAFPHPIEFMMANGGHQTRPFVPPTPTIEDTSDFGPLSGRLPDSLNGQALGLFSKTKFYRRLANRFMRSPEELDTPERESFNAAKFYFPKIQAADHAIFLQALAMASQKPGGYGRRLFEKPWR